MRSPAGVASSIDSRPRCATSAQHASRMLVPIRSRRRDAVTSTMLTQAKSSGYGRTAPDATMTPRAFGSPNTVPCRRNKAQSSLIWFQPASDDSATQSAMWASVSLKLETSVDPIANLEMGRLVQTWAIVRDPVGNPVDHLPGRYPWAAKKASILGCISQQCGWQFITDDLRLLAKPLAKHPGEPSDGYNLGPGYVEWSSRRGHIPQGA